MGAKCHEEESMKQLWAPWRLEYIKGPKMGGCIFCAMPSRGQDQETRIVHRGGRSYLVLNAFPYNSGHLMAVPFRHVAFPHELDDAELIDLHRMVDLAIKVLQEAYAPDGFNIGMNLGRAAGAGIADHLHIHIVPRWAGDTNFMPVLADVKVIPEFLDATYVRLKEAVEKLENKPSR